MPDEIDIAADAFVAGRGDDRVGLGMHAAAQLIPLAARHAHLLAHAVAEVGAVFPPAWRAVVAGRHDLVVADDDRAVLPAQAGRPLQHGLGDVQVIVLLYDPLHGAPSVFFGVFLLFCSVYHITLFFAAQPKNLPPAAKCGILKTELL